ncbi:MAG: cation-translocating P-type ATPase [Myxococcota bacterium]
MTHWHAATVAEVESELATDARAGLAPSEALRRLAGDGPNELERSVGPSPLAILGRQFASIVIWVLIGAGVVSAALGERIDGAAILAIVVLNAALGFAQELRAERAVAALARLAAPRARVLRGGHSQVIAARDVVRGDLLVLEAGDLVAADARLVEASELRANEAPLTGESEPVSKSPAALAAKTPLAERRNLVFLGTSVAAGSGRALVVSTGMQTEVGRIARLLEHASSGPTPLQLRLDALGRRLLWACLAIVAAVFALGLARGTDPFELFLGAVSLAVAAVPEGLPAVVTVALALGVQRMVRRNALIRRLPSVETLGATQVICTDKTGTLTVGAMTVRRLVTADAVYRVSGEGYGVAGEILEQDPAAPDRGPLVALLRAATACNDAELLPAGSDAAIAGDPTEAALLVAAAKAGLTREALEREEPRVHTNPFDSDRKRMSVVCARGAERWAYVKGAPESVLERCASVRTARGVESLDESIRARLREACARLAAEALRVLAVAERPVADANEGDVELGLTFLGLAGMQDPPRAEARDAVAKCHRAGIRVVMITGDHPDTARAIASELGILRGEEEVLVGAELESMTEADLEARVERILVYARVTAEHKLRIVRAWKRRGFVVAMTGDGVNDAPALREASIGIAMGITGTEVAKEASDMVVTDDDFASIVAAVEEGRGIYDNVAKTLAYLLAGNAGELAVMLIAAVFGYPAPLLPIQLLWINLVTDGLPALALATDPIDDGVLERPPRRPDAQIADRAMLRSLALTGALTASVALASFALVYEGGGPLEDARDAAFSTLVFAELLRAVGARSDTRLVHEIGLFSNLRLFAIVAASFSLQISIHHSEPLARFFATRPISLALCLSWIALGALPLLVLETRKWIRRGRGSGASPPA